MNTEQALDIFRQALQMTLLLSMPLLMCALVVGVATNVFQAATQVTEATLALVPKILSLVLAIFLFGPWMLDHMIDFTTKLFENIPNQIR